MIFEPEKTLTRGEQIVASNIKKYGSYENWKAEMRKRAILGGKKSKRVLTHEQASAMGKIGGKAKKQ